MSLFNAISELFAPRPNKERRVAEWIAEVLDLSHLAPFRDLLLVAGFGCLVYGVGILCVPAAWMLAGAGLMAVSLAMSSK